MLRTLLILLLPIGAAGAQQPPEPVGAGPEPAAYSISWEVDFKYLDLRRIRVQAPGRGAEDYWYLLYTATNTSNTTQHFFPMAEVVTNDLRVIEANIGIHRLVFDAIRERHKITHPYLVHPTRAIGDLKVGDDNARESVAIWRAADIDANQFSVFIAGLSGEARLIRNPAYDPDRPEAQRVKGADGRVREVFDNPRYFTLRKTLEIQYTLPGSQGARSGGAEPLREHVRWVMR